MRYLTWFPVENQLPQIDKVPGYNRKGSRFTGSPRKHPYDQRRVLLITGLLPNDEQACLDFSLDDILHIDAVENLVDGSGESIPLLEIWVRNGAQAFSLYPFEVGA